MHPVPSAGQALTPFSARFLPSLPNVRAPFPTRAIAALLLIGLIDLLATTVLHARGAIVETNPLMAPLLERGEAPFVVVKAATLVAAGLLMMRAGRRDPNGVRRACWAGSGVYVAALVATACRS